MGSQIPNSDVDWDFTLTDKDFETIDSAVSKYHSVRCCNENDVPPCTRRRLPESLFVFRQQRDYETSSSSLSLCNYRRRTKPYASPLPEIKFGGRIVYGRTVEEVERAAFELRSFVEDRNQNEGDCILGLDIEWRPSFIRGVAAGKAAVMQICGDNSCCYVLHIFHSQIPESLKALLEDPTVPKVGVFIAGDANKVLRDHNVSINNLRDLSDLANRKKLGGGRRQWSLSSLAEMLICKALPKPKWIRLGNWEAKFLSKEQLVYAATDVYASWYLYQVLINLEDPDSDDNKSVEQHVA